jgi:hypothetical protein
MLTGWLGRICVYRMHICINPTYIYLYMHGVGSGTPSAVTAVKSPRCSPNAEQQLLQLQCGGQVARRGTAWLNGLTGESLSDRLISWDGQGMASDSCEPSFRFRQSSSWAVGIQLYP